jgi:hypothetical protein
MVVIGVQLEEGVREGRLVKESVPASNSKMKEQEVSMVKEHPRPQYPLQPYQQQQPRQQASRTQFALIPMKYADLLPQLLEKNLVQTKAPPPVPARLPAWYRPDLFCTFHQGAPGHDIEHCNAMKKAVQDLIRTNRLTF